MTVASHSYCVKMMQYPVLNEVLTELHTAFSFIRDEDIGFYEGIEADIFYDYDETDLEGPTTKHAYVISEVIKMKILQRKDADAIPAPTMSELSMAFSLLNDRGLGGRLDLSFDDERGDYAIFTPKDKSRFKLDNFKLNFPKSAYVEDYLALMLIAVAEEMIVPEEDER